MVDRDDIIKMAQKAGFATSWTEAAGEALERFAALVAAHEREECSKVCESYDDRNPGVTNIGYYLGKQIRARGEQ